MLEGNFKVFDNRTSGVFSHRKPVTPCITVSLGPPLLHATTGLWYCMASSGTIPKCSSFGVYKTHKLWCNKTCFWWLLIEGRKKTLSESSRSSFSLHFRCEYSWNLKRLFHLLSSRSTWTLSCKRESKPPARISMYVASFRFCWMNLWNARIARRRFLFESKRFMERNIFLRLKSEGFTDEAEVSSLTFPEKLVIYQEKFWRLYPHHVAT